MKESRPTVRELILLCDPRVRSSIPGVWRLPLGGKFYLEPVFEVEKCNILHSEEKSKENLPKVNSRNIFLK